MTPIRPPSVTGSAALMPRKFLKRYLPSPAHIRRQRALGMFGQRLGAAELWHLNRRSVSTAFGVGLFLAFFPVPGQTLIAVLVAMWLRCNLPLSVALVWISNPVTIPPMFFFAYKVGTWVLGVPPQAEQVSLSLEWLLARLGSVWQPLLVGSLICGVVAGLVGWGVIQGLWRWNVVQRWERRRSLRRLRRERDSTDD